MITPSQLKELEQILGKCVRQCAWIEWQISIIHAYDETKPIPSALYQDKNLNVRIDKKIRDDFNKTCKDAENDSFNEALKSLIKKDKENKYFNVKQYRMLNEIRKLRNDVFHNTYCLYLDWENNGDKSIIAYNNDLKKAKKLMSYSNQYIGVVKKQLNKIFLASTKNK